MPQQQPSRKCKQCLHIIEIRERSHRDAHGAGGFTVDAQAEVVDGHFVFVVGRGEAHIQFHAGDAERHFTCAGVAEAAGAQRDIDLVGFAFNEAMIEGFAVLVVEIDRDRSASSFGGVGSEQPHQRLAGAVFHGREIFQQPTRERFDPFTDDFIANGLDMLESDLKAGMFR
jgi:hypothetical protein